MQLNCYTSGLSLVEVLIALTIMIGVIIPIFGILSQDVKETDIQLAHTFAIDRARMVMNSLLGDVPFSELSPGAPAILRGGSIGLAQILFPGCEMVDNGRVCLGIASDVRGIWYQLYLRSDPFNDTTIDVTTDELTFGVYKNPRIEKQQNWETFVKECTVEEMTNNQPSILKKTSGFKTPYRFFDIPGINQDLWGPEEEALRGPLRYDQRRISQPDSNGNYCLLQRLVLEIRWNLAQKYYTQPSTNAGRPQQLVVVTFKAKLDD